MGPIQVAVVCVLSLFALSVTHPATCQELPTSYSSAEVAAHSRCERRSCGDGTGVSVPKGPPKPPKPRELIGSYMMVSLRKPIRIIAGDIRDDKTGSRRVVMYHLHLLKTFKWTYDNLHIQVFKYDDHYQLVQLGRKHRLSVSIKTEGTRYVRTFPDTEAGAAKQKGVLDDRFYFKVSKHDTFAGVKGGLGVYITSKAKDKDGKEIELFMKQMGHARDMTMVPRADLNKRETAFEYQFLDTTSTGIFAKPSPDDLYWFAQNHSGYGILASGTKTGVFAFGAALGTGAKFHLIYDVSSCFKRHTNGGLSVMSPERTKTGVNGLIMKGKSEADWGKVPTAIVLKRSHVAGLVHLQTADGLRTFTVHRTGAKLTLRTDVKAGTTATTWQVIRAPYNIADLLGAS